MKKAGLLFSGLMLFLLMQAPCVLLAQRPSQQQRSRSASALRGVYRLDLESSDKLYSVVSGASSNLPFGEQQRFFIDLTIRLTPPDQLAIEQRGQTVSIASSRAPRISFDASGVTHSERAEDGHTIRTRAVVDAQGRLTVNTTGNAEDRFTVTFEPLDDGRRLRVTRRIYAAELNSPVVIHSVYNRISEVARWDIYGEPAPPQPDEGRAQQSPPALRGLEEPTVETLVRRRDQAEAAALRASLEEWVAATNARDIGRQMSFYPPRLEAFYLTRNVARAEVRAEKARVFARAQNIEVRADDPEIVFTDGGRTALMRFRKRYAIEGGPGARRGEVIQELRWRKTASGWKITSERDVRVLSRR